MRWPRPSFYAVTLLVIALDQLAKMWATLSLRPLVSVALIPGFFDLTYVRNTGVAFGMLQGHGLLVGLFVVALALAAFYYTRALDWSGWEPNLVGGCLCGGALGNLLDRARLGYVVDFLDVHIGPHRWPTFNVADSLICLAVGWIVWRQLGGEKVKGKG
ncbi:MAG TPA: signal peptidase II [Candidatus Methylacidiphilales bacterium]|jgi:signal peptidase II|nr:signal peptidase II [Candidatus Methylacidiphilales bacterium]